MFRFELQVSLVFLLLVILLWWLAHQGGSGA